MRTIIYARYSSENQREASIEDQIRICQARADREGWQVVGSFTDQALSGATTLRAGYQGLLTAVRSGNVDIVLAESLDRFSRDLEHIASFYKQCVFNNVVIHTLSEGIVSELHVGFKGLMGSMFLKDLADKTRRGLEGRIHAGRCTGSPAFGYSVVKKLADNGELDRGLRAIDPDQAAVVRRIFRDFVAGVSPLGIARALNGEGIKGPGGGIWYDSSIRGRAKRGDGILRNELYAGRNVWRRRVNLKNPISGARVRREAAPETFINAPVPHLRIIDEGLWQAAQVRLAAEAAAPTAPGAKGDHAFWDRRHPKHLLSGKIACGVCGRLFATLGKDYLGCVAAKHHVCGNNHRVRRQVVEAQVLGILNTQLMRPDLVEAFVAAFNEECGHLVVELHARAHSRQRERATLDRKIANLVEAIGDGQTSAAIMAKIQELEAVRAGLGEAGLDEAQPLPVLDPGMGLTYATRMAELSAALQKGDDPEGLEIARGLIDRVLIHPGETDDDPPGVELIGELISLLKVAGVGGTGTAAKVGQADQNPVLDLFVCSVKADPGAKPLALLAFPSPASSGEEFVELAAAALDEGPGGFDDEGGHAAAGF